MSVKELLQSAEYVIDANGKKKSVVVDLAVWEELLTLLEDLEDGEEIKQMRDTKEEHIPWDQAKTELRSAGKGV